MARQHVKILLFGGSGQIGGALSLCAAAQRPSRAEIRTFPWAWVTEEKLYANQIALRSRIDAVTQSWTEFDIGFANGVTDPKAPASDLTRSNVTFPLAVINATQEREGIRYLTLGTVFEDFHEFALTNPYIASKRELCEGVLAQKALTNAGRAVHLRLHTVYGGRPKPYMFLGQMIEALEQGREFRMTSGEQLREYHHVHDIAGAMLALLRRNWQFGAKPLDLSSGAPVRLADLATAVFTGSGRLELLKIGSLAPNPADNRDRVFPRSDPSLLPYYRDPILGVLEYVRSHCSLTAARREVS
jgi:nucleoside-diphosphate-sugar epimerase